MEPVLHSLGGVSILRYELHFLSRVVALPEHGLHHLPGDWHQATVPIAGQQLLALVHFVSNLLLSHHAVLPHHLLDELQTDLLQLLTDYASLALSRLQPAKPHSEERICREFIVEMLDFSVGKYQIVSN
jgi:hypothetical protein